MSPSSPERVLVTGATGLLGQRLVPLLVAAGHAVRVLVRGDAAAPAGVEVVRGDLRDAAAVQQAVRGCAAVYHLGAVTAKWLPDAREFEAVNVGATLQLARMAADAGAQRIVHVSSFTVFGPSAPGTVLDESAAIRPELLHNDYQRSKARAHLQLQQQAQRDGLPVVIACPGVLFDAGDAGHRNPVAELMCAQLAGRLRWFPGGGRRIWTMAWTAEVAAVLLTMRARAGAGEVFLLGSAPRPLRAVFEFIAAHTRQPPPRSLPLSPVLLAGRALQLAGRLLRRSPRLSHAALCFLAADWAFSSARAARAFGYRPLRFEDRLLAIWDHLHGHRLVAMPPPAVVPAA